MTTEQERIARAAYEGHLNCPESNWGWNYFDEQTRLSWLRAAEAAIMERMRINTESDIYDETGLLPPKP